MTIIRSTWLWSISLILCLVFAVIGWSKYIMLSIDLTLAGSWATTIVEIRDSALKESNPTEVADDLEYIARYYRATVPPHSPLSRISTALLEQIRSECILVVINHLKNITKDNLGNDPTPWIMKYAAKDYRDAHLNRFFPRKTEQAAAVNP